MTDLEQAITALRSFRKWAEGVRRSFTDHPATLRRLDECEGMHVDMVMLDADDEGGVGRYGSGATVKA